MLTKQRCEELFTYHDGALYRKQTVAGIPAGSLAGSLSSAGYFHVRVDDKRQLWHRIIFLMHFGWLPPVVDHIDGDPRNNRIENLRAATSSQNQHNRKANKNCNPNGKGLKQLSSGSWLVRLNREGKSVFCRAFKEFELAQLVAEEARELYHGKFARHF